MVIWTLFSDGASTIKATGIWFCGLYLKLEKTISTLKENAAGALKLPMLDWSA